MNKATKAVLLSALLFPGSGHYYLKKPFIGSVLAIITVVCLYFFTVSVFTLATAISDKILRGEIPPDIIEISTAITNGLAESGLHQLNILTISLFCCWIVGMLDSYRLGKREDSKSE